MRLLREAARRRAETNRTDEGCVWWRMRMTVQPASKRATRDLADSMSAYPLLSARVVVARAAAQLVCASELCLRTRSQLWRQKEVM